MGKLTVCPANATCLADEVPEAEDGRRPLGEVLGVDHLGEAEGGDKQEHLRICRLLCLLLLLAVGCLGSTQQLFVALMEEVVVQVDVAWYLCDSKKKNHHLFWSYLRRPPLSP